MRLVPAVVCMTLVVPLAACSGSSSGDVEGESFCDQAQLILSEIDAAAALDDDPSEFTDAISEINEGFSEADPPSDIAADWDALATIFADLGDTLKGVDPDDQDAVSAAMSEFSAKANTTELTDSSDRVSNYVTANCTD